MSKEIRTDKDTFMFIGMAKIMEMITIIGVEQMLENTTN